MNAPLVCGARRPTGLWWSGHGARLASGGLGTAPDWPLVVWARRPTGLWWSGHGARVASGGLGTAPDRPLVVWARRPSGLWWSGHGARPASQGRHGSLTRSGSRPPSPAVESKTGPEHSSACPATRGTFDRPLGSTPPRHVAASRYDGLRRQSPGPA